MITQTTYPDYQAIVNELIKGCKSEHSNAATSIKDLCERNGYTAQNARIEVLKEYRTIRFGGGRQSGKTRFGLELLRENIDDTIVFMKDNSSVTSTITSWVNQYGDSVSPDFQKKLISRILGQAVLKDYNPSYPFFKKDVMKKAPKYIVIDEASNHLHFFVKSLYEWVSKTADSDPIIILVG